LFGDSLHAGVHVTSTSVLCGIGLAVGVAVGTTGGCVDCNDDLCNDALWIDIREPGSGALADGDYRFEVETDGELRTATCTVGDGGHHLSCDRDEIGLQAPIFGGPGHPHRVFELYFVDDVPETVDVRVVQGDAVLVDEHREIHYELAEPKCDPDCKHAQLELTFAR
jgi:hypothetical protein